MGIRIEEINIKNLGPITDKKLDLSTINLIYGKNESGKTHLVEFIIRSLFKSANYPGIRNIIGTGQISVQGLGDTAEHFSPISKIKLEEYLKRKDETLPTNISRLLVVRAGEVSMVDNRQVGIDRSVLEEYLSDTGLINSIRTKISLTVQKSSVSSGVIQGNRQGPIKDHYARKDEQSNLDELLSEITNSFSTGYRTSLQIELKEVSESLNAEKQAKCYLAYKLNQNIQHIEQELEKISEERIQQISRDLDERKSKSDSLDKLKANYDAKISGSTELAWLKAALGVYEALLNGVTQSDHKWLLFIAAFFFVGSGVFMFLRQPYLAVTMMLLGVAIGYGYVYNLKKRAIHASQNTETERVKIEFKQKFDLELTDIATLKMKYDEQNGSKIAVDLMDSQIKELQAEIDQLEQKISDNLFEMAGKRLPKESWVDLVHKSGQYFRDQKTKLEEYKVEFAALQVEPEDFRIEQPSQNFDELRLKRLEQKVAELTSELNSEDIRLNSLRQRLAQETHSDISLPWETLIEQLQGKRNQCNENYQEITAKILSGIVVNSVLDEIYKEEEKRIQEGLRSQVVSNYLKLMTTHYERIEFENGLLKVADPFAEYDFSDLSTGTQEQVLLALRMGISSHCFLNQSMFLVLDDAFQHSDWVRREYLIDSVMKIASLGWQIIYMTMDDNIRDLMIKKAQLLFPNEYRVFEL